MALEEYLGAIVMEIDGKEIECVSVEVTRNLGRKMVKTMNKTGRPAGFAKGVEDISLSVTAVIPAHDAPDWASIEGSKITIYPPVRGGQRTSYLDCFTTELGSSFSVDNEARQSIKMGTLREVKE